MDRADTNNAICSIAKAFREYITYANYLTSENSYKSASSKLENLEFILNDVSTFAGLVDREQFTDKANYWTVGLFISAAINKVITKDEVMVMNFVRLGYPVDCIGYRLKQGNLSLQGDAGDYLGENMSGGKITIQGNAGNYVGYAMSGGEITIQGSVVDHVGTYMSGGTIHVKGQIGSISESCKGRIYHDATLLR